MLAAGLLGVVLLAPTGSVIGKEASRQTATAVFGERLPASPTGASVRIRYRDPADPEGKPPAVQRVVTEFAPGTRIDTKVPAACEASDADLVSEGAEACPPQSRVGKGKVKLDTGVEGSRFLENDLTLLNNTGELILLTQQRGSSPPSRLVVRAKITGSHVIAELPPVPGGGSDGFTAIRDVDFTVSRITDRVGGETRSYITTPGTCPEVGRFANGFTFTYRDGVTQDVASPSPCSQPDRKPPAIRLAGVSDKGCVKRALRARIRVLDPSPLARVVVKINGRRLRVTQRRRLVITLRRSALRPGFNNLRITARDSAGNRAGFTRRFLRCR